MAAMGLRLGSSGELGNQQCDLEQNNTKQNEYEARGNDTRNPGLLYFNPGLV